jgi:hypothetical protein
MAANRRFVSMGSAKGNPSAYGFHGRILVRGSWRGQRHWASEALIALELLSYHTRAAIPRFWARRMWGRTDGSVVLRGAIFIVRPHKMMERNFIGPCRGKHDHGRRSAARGTHIPLRRVRPPDQAIGRDATDRQISGRQGVPS